MHLAETKEQARKDVEYGIVPFSHYFTHVLPAGPVRGDTAEEIIDNVDEDGFAVIGTPDDAIRKIQELVDQSGGFGTFLLFGHDWATPEATKRSFELFAQYVMPHFQGQLDWPQRSSDWVTGSGGEFVGRAANAIMQGDRRSRGEQADELRLCARSHGGGGSCPPSCTVVMAGATELRFARSVRPLAHHALSSTLRFGRRRPCATCLLERRKRIEHTFASLTVRRAPTKAADFSELLRATRLTWPLGQGSGWRSWTT